MSEPRPPPSLAALFTGFFTIGLCGFGGMLPWARRMIVEQRRWMTAAEFTELLGLCQRLPGGNIINLTVAVGARFAGAPGSVVAFTGLMAAPMAVVIGLGFLYDRYRGLPVVPHGFAGLAAVASALMFAAGLKIAAPSRFRPVGVGVALITLVAIALLRWPLGPLLLALVAVAILLTWRIPGQTRARATSARSAPWPWCSRNCRCRHWAAPIPYCRKCSARWCRCIHG
jgi:chromate transporter